MNTELTRENIFTYKKQKDGLERRYKMKQRGLPCDKGGSQGKNSGIEQQNKHFKSRINQYL